MNGRKGCFGNDRRRGQDPGSDKKERSQSEKLANEGTNGFLVLDGFLHNPRDLLKRARGGICKRSSLLNLDICVELLQHR